MRAVPTNPGKLLKLRDVIGETSLGEGTIRRRMKAGTFPKPYRLRGHGAHRTVWAQFDIEQWKRAELVPSD